MQAVPIETTKIVGILNMTADSFSDGGKYLHAEAAIRQAESLRAQGADLIDLGAESSRPDAEAVPVQEQIDRLIPVIQALKTEKIPFSVDTYRPEVMARVLELGADMINDINALREAGAVETVRRYDAPVVLMYSRSPGPQADRTVRGSESLMDEIIRFFSGRIGALTEQGIRRENLILDPGMGLFLGANPEPSLTVLKHLKELRCFGLRTYISVSRKSFIGSVLHREVSQRAAGTLAAEIWAALQGAEYIRTHEVKPLRDALDLLKAIRQIP